MKRPKKRIEIPLTSEEHYIQTRQQINALNRKRSKAMERRIAGHLKGRRIPMSGAAAQYKGDVEIPFYNYPGKYIIECKLTAQLNKSGIPTMTIVFSWLTKIHEEARSMNAKFAVLIVHFQGYGNDYVFMKIDTARLFTDRYRSPYADILFRLMTETNVEDWRYSKKGKPYIAHITPQNEIESAMVEIEGIKGLRVLLPDSEYLIVHLDSFKMLTEHL
jgi:hypothetical protein